MDAVLDEAFIDMRVRWEVSDFIDELTEQLTRDRTRSSTCSSRGSGGASRSPRSTPWPTCAPIRTSRAPGSGATTSTRSLGTVPSPGDPFRVNHDWWHWTSAPRSRRAHPVAARCRRSCRAADRTSDGRDRDADEPSAVVVGVRVAPLTEFSTVVAATRNGET